MGVGVEQAKSSLFTRKSSGLVKTAGAFDVLAFNLSLISIGAAVATIFFYGPAFYPGASTFGSIALTTIGSAVFVGGFWFWSVTFPRTGGNYVFLTRSVHPGIGFSLSFVECGVTLIFGGLTAMFLAQTALSPFFGTVGILSGTQWWTDAGAWIATKDGSMVVGAIAITIAAAIPLIGLRQYFAVQKVLFWVAIGGLLLGLVILVFTSRTGFLGQLQDRTGLTERGVVAAARDSGWVPTEGYDLGATLKFMVWPLAWLLAGLYSVGFGSEIRRVSRSQLVGMVGAVILAGIVVAAYAPALNSTIGHNLLGALSWNAGEAPDQSTAVPPFAPLLIALGSGSTVLGVLVGLGFVAWFMLLIPAQLLYGQRIMMAWSFDRIMPDRLGYVSPRFHSPVVAIVVSWIAGVAALALLLYGGLNKLVFVEGIVFVWCVVLAVGAAFPWLRPAFYARSPVSRYRFAGLPLMTVVCALGCAFGIYALILNLGDDLAAGHSKNAILPNLALLAAGIIVYVVVRAIRRSQGVDVNLVYREIPID
jgi:APA family basic amino acid/polyamine antiporter